VEVNVGAKFLKSDCSSLGHEGTLVDFANSAPLPLGDALKRIADMTSDKDPQRIFVPDELIKAPFAQDMVHPPKWRSTLLDSHSPAVNRGWRSKRR